MTTISWLSSSIPAEALARPDHNDQLAPMSASDNAFRSSSPSATAAPSALAARDRPIDLSVSRVATAAPRLSASATRWAVSSGHFTCTKCTSAGSAIAGVGHGRAHPGGDLIDLRQPAEMLERQRRRVGAADRE